MRKILILLFLLFVSASWGQWLEKNIVVGSFPTGIVFQPASNKLYCKHHSGESLAVVDCSIDSVVAQLDLGTGVHAMACNTRENKLYCAQAFASAIVVVDGAGDSVLTTLNVGGRPHWLLYDSVQGKLYCADADSDRVWVIDAHADTILTSVEVGEEPQRLFKVESLDKLYCSNRADSSVSVIDCAFDSVVAVIPVPEEPFEFGYNPVTGRLYCGHYDEAEGLTVIDPVADTVIHTVLQGLKTRWPTVNQVHNKVYCTFDYQDTLAVLDGATDTVITVLTLAHRPFPLFFNSLNHKLYSCGRNEMFVIDGESNTVRCTIPVGYSPTGLAWDSTTNRLYVNNNLDSTISIIRDSIPAGVEETAEGGGLKAEHRTPTIVRDVLWLGRIGDSPGRARYSPQFAVLLDISGRRVKDLQPGANDIRHIAPGVYFCRLTAGSASPRSADNGRRSADTRKVVIQR